MCPACLATTWMMIVAGAGSAGGLTALVRKLRGRNLTEDAEPRPVTPDSEETPR